MITGKPHSKELLRRQKNGIDISTTIYGMIPPSAVEVEVAILGACMIEAGAFNRAAEIIRPEAFYSDAHQRIFGAMQQLDTNRTPIDVLTVAEALKLTEDLDVIGGPFYITKLTNSVVSSAHIEIHCRIVLEKFICREMIRLSGETLTAAYSDSADFHDLMDQHERTLSEITTGIIRNSFSDTSRASAEVIDRLYFLKINPGAITGVPTGYPIIDRLTNGWQSTDLIVLAARPSVGKTAFALNLARAASRSAPVGIFSMEMSRSQLMQRLLSAESGVHMDCLNSGRLSESAMHSILVASEAINRDKIFIDDTGGLTSYELRSKARRMVSKHGVKIIFIDYLQLMAGDENSRNNREQEISKISRELKALAKEIKIPIIALSQLNRSNETQKREPQLSDLRDSGAIEQDADVVMFLWRDDYQVTDQLNGEPSNTAYVKFSKHRNGALDKIAMRTDMRIQTWFDPNQWDVYERRINNRTSPNYTKGSEVDENPF